MPTHSSVLAWRIPGTGEPGGLLSMGSHRVRYDWSDLAAAGHITLLELSNSSQLCSDIYSSMWRRLSTEELMLLNCGVGEDSWESLGLQGDQPWDFFGRNDAKAEAPILWPPHARSWLIGKDSDAGRDWRQEEKGTTEDEMAGWDHGLDGRESEWTLGVGDGQGGLACCDSWGCKESEMTEWLNWTELNMHWVITRHPELC